MRIVRNDEGAIMVMAVFMAAIVIGCIYYVSGLGAAIVAQERMQDAADATAFSSAVIHARGMNLLALINIILASLLAFLVMLSMLSSLLNLAAKILFAIAFLVPPAAPAARATQSVSATVERKVKPAATKLVEKSMKGLSGMQRIVRKSIPILANINALKLARENYQPVAQVAFTFPILGGLPSENGDFRTLCTKAGEYAAEVIMYPLKVTLGNVPKSGWVPGPMERLAGKGSKAYALYYCGVGPKPKRPSHSVDVAIPEIRTHKGQTCQREDAPNREQACADYEKELASALAAYDSQEGTCSAGDAEANRLCDVRRRQARTQCHPVKNGAVKNISYRKITRTRHFRLENNRVVEDEPTFSGDGRTKKEKVASGEFGHPIRCKVSERSWIGPEETFTEWNFDPDEPLCQEKHDVPSVADFRAQKTKSIDIDVEEYSDVLACTVKRTFEGPEANEQASKQMKKAKPQEMCSCAAQGENMFQIRSVVFGDTASLSENASRGIEAATGQTADGGALASLASAAGRFSMAQAEYYFDSENSEPSTWLWSMSWKARMRRLSFRRPEWKCPAAKNTCEGSTGAGRKQLSQEMRKRTRTRSSSITEALSGGLNSMIVH